MEWQAGNMEWPAVAAFCAIIGHVFTVWLRFKGGKGVATGCGAFLALSPPAVLTTLVVFLAILLLTRYISAASILATAFYPFCAYFIYGVPAPVIIWAIPGALLIIAKHHQNIRRLLAGTENKFLLGAKA